MTDVHYFESTTASYSKSSVSMFDSTGMQTSNPFNQITSIGTFFPIIYHPDWTICQKQESEKTFKFDWAGGLSDLKGKINSVELAHDALAWR